MKWIRNLWGRFKTLSIVRKMILAYILLVFLPVVLFGSIFLYMSYHNLLDRITAGNQHLLNQAANSLNVSLTQVESIYPLFQRNSIINDYLKGYYRTEGEQVYHYLKDIRPIFTFAYSSNQAVDRVILYKTRPNLMSIPGEIEDLDAFPSPEIRPMIERMAINQGIWIPIRHDLSELPYLAYYKKIYNENYNLQLAVLEVVVDNQILESFIHTMDVSPNVGVILVKDGAIFYQSPHLDVKPGKLSELGTKLQRQNKSYLFWQEQQLLVNTVRSPQLGLDFYFFSPIEDILPDLVGNSVIMGVVVLVSLIVLSAIYYVTASMLTRRVLKLARHMRKVDEHHLAPLDTEGYEDELGYLTASYNSMIRRIDELINEVNVAELTKKNAEYLAMQAQVKPHFLYNTLESIRMMAELNDDQEVVEATYTFGQLLRYSLSPGTNEATLQEEVDNITHYLKIHKIRMLDRLQYDIQVDCPIDQIRSPKFILQPIIENSIKHGLAKKRHQGRIKVHIFRADPYLYITIRDNGAGIPAQRLETIRGVLGYKLDRSELQTKESGLGVFNVNERIKAFYGEESSLEIDSIEGEGTTCCLKLYLRGENGVEADDRG